MKRELVKGFTIVELIIYMGILTTLLLVLTSAFGTVLDVYLEGQSSSQVGENSRYILSKLSYDVSSSDEILKPSEKGESSQSMQINKNGVTLNYALSNGNLELSEENSIYMINGYDSKISDLNFIKVGTDSVKVSFTITSLTKRSFGEETRDFETTLGIR